MNTKTNTKSKSKAKTEKKAKATMSDTLKKYRGGYVKTDGYNKVSINNGDDVASLLKMFEPERVIAIAETVLSLEPNELLNKYAHLNPGQKRMNAGNRIRAALKNGAITKTAIKKAAKSLKAAA